MLLAMCSAVSGMSRERDELVALLNARERRCFEILSLVGQNVDSDVSGNNSLDNNCTTDITALKVCHVYVLF